jgi:Uma2 family endonuclease
MSVVPAATAKPRATIEDLYKVEGKAEIVDGEIKHLMATGRMPNYAAGAIYVSLFQYVRTARLRGVAATDNAGFTVRLPNRESFSPDAAYYVGPNSGMRFFEGAPVFAVEVRSEGDYGVSAEAEMAAKRRDYFAAGTRVVWDVDLRGPDVVRKYTPDAPDAPTVFRRSEVADAEPAVPGWTMPVGDLYEPDGGATTVE